MAPNRNIPLDQGLAGMKIHKKNAPSLHKGKNKTEKRKEETKNILKITDQTK